tara:strand:+ start:288 stop:698 length:411 start_codon:yes stop_codon:yes gene_type:complete
MKKNDLIEMISEVIEDNNITEIQLGETTVRLSPKKDANFHSGQVQLVGMKGKVSLSKADMRALLSYIKTEMGYSYMMRREGKLYEGKIKKLPSGIKVELDTFKGLTIYTREGKKIQFDRHELSMFIRATSKQMGIR